MRRHVAIAIVVALLSLPLVAGSALAAIQGSCPTSDGSKMLVFENMAGDTSDGDDSLWVCNAYSNLHEVAHTVAGLCNIGSIYLGGTVWGDCVSSWRVWLPNNDYVACLYEHSDYGGTLLQYRVGPQTGVRYNLTSSTQDEASSIRIVIEPPQASAASC